MIVVAFVVFHNGEVFSDYVHTDGHVLSFDETGRRKVSWLEASDGEIFPFLTKECIQSGDDLPLNPAERAWVAHKRRQAA